MFRGSRLLCPTLVGSSACEWLDMHWFHPTLCPTFSGGSVAAALQLGPMALSQQQLLPSTSPLTTAEHFSVFSTIWDFVAISARMSDCNFWLELVARERTQGPRAWRTRWDVCKHPHTLPLSLWCLQVSCEGHWCTAPCWALLSCVQACLVLSGLSPSPLPDSPH